MRYLPNNVLKITATPDVSCASHDDEGLGMTSLPKILLQPGTGNTNCGFRQRTILRMQARNPHGGQKTNERCIADSYIPYIDNKGKISPPFPHHLLQPSSSMAYVTAQTEQRL